MGGERWHKEGSTAVGRSGITHSAKSIEFPFLGDPGGGNG